MKFFANLVFYLPRLSKLGFSFALVAFGQPALSGMMSIGAASFGYALFWSVAIKEEKRFLFALVWFAAVQAIQLNWLTSTHYMGPAILVVYALLSLAIGLQFALLTQFIRLPMTWLQISALSGFWVILEWLRIFLLTGFTWNPIGMPLAANSYSIQLASLFGVYGLCFWVIFANLAALKNKMAWLPIAVFPYFFGFCHQLYWEEHMDPGEDISVALVQTGLKPEERDWNQDYQDEYIHPMDQWDRILSFMHLSNQAHYDLIVLPEGALPGGVKRPIYPLNGVRAIWRSLGTNSDFPPMEMPFAEKNRVTNAFWLQSLANHYGAEVVVGLDDDDQKVKYNAAFHFVPLSNLDAGPTTISAISRYEKQILIPVGEYIPFTLLGNFLSSQFGIEGSFEAGTETKIFKGALPLGIFICLEETYGYLVRESRLAGAELFVNVTNDVWFPDTRLPWHHFDHGRIRAAENGVCLLRACNTGVTAAVDCFGKVIQTFPVAESGVLTVNMQVRSFPTLYTYWGDLPILFLGLVFIFFYFVSELEMKRKLKLRKSTEAHSAKSL